MIKDVYGLDISSWFYRAQDIAKKQYDKVLGHVQGVLEGDNRNDLLLHLKYALKQVVLLSMLEQPTDTALDLARSIAQEFKKPEKYDLWIDAVANGDTFFYNWHQLD